jgi:hypothetical protein
LLQGYGHYIEEYKKGEDGQWRIKQIRLTRIRVDYLNAKKKASSRTARA